ncbi:MAG: transcriptional regulator [Gammaproteobacteria bacterium]|nr:MAG: transcriptional regulator [Gammaproteobacteria bacterium]
MSFLFQSVTAGLAAASVVVVLRPDLLVPTDHTPAQAASPNPTPASVPAVDGPLQRSYADAVSRAVPAVVNLQADRSVPPGTHPLLDDPFFRQYFGARLGPNARRRQPSLGSGVIVSEQGLILTNHHLIRDAERISILLHDGRNLPAQVVGTDPDTDLAVLKTDASQLPAIVIGDADGVRVGDVVLAIGNPFGVGQTVTLGIVSATGRSGLGINTFEDFIQTDAAINPGNSGGALVDARGRLLGINTAIFSRSGGSQGIGFAIPVTLAQDVMQQIIERGYVARGWLGVEIGEIDQNIAEAIGLGEANGVLITGVLSDGPADRAGIEPGDVIVSIGDVPIASARSALNRIAGMTPGDTVPLQVLRGEQTLSLDAIVAQRPTAE